MLGLTLSQSQRRGVSRSLGRRIRRRERLCRFVKETVLVAIWLKQATLRFRGRKGQALKGRTMRGMRRGGAVNSYSNGSEGRKE